MSIALRSATNALRLLRLGGRSDWSQAQGAWRELSVVATASSSPTGEDRQVHSHCKAVVTTTRSFSRRGGRMGHHLETLDEMAHRESRNEAKERRKKKKSKRGGDSTDDQAVDMGSAASPSSEAPVTPEEIEGETLFDHGSEDELPALPDPNDVRERMLRVVTAMEESFKSIRGGEPTAELFDAVQVKAYGSLTPLSAVAQVVITSSNQASLSCYDPETAKDVRDAVRDAPGMNFNPYVEEGGGGTVIVPIPKVSAETRRAIVKQLGHQAESMRQRVRRIRRGAMDVVRKGKDGKLEGVSKDDAFRVGKDIESVTDEVIRILNESVEKKQQSVTDV